MERSPLSPAQHLYLIWAHLPALVTRLSPPPLLWCDRCWQSSMLSPPASPAWPGRRSDPCTFLVKQGQPPLYPERYFKSCVYFVDIKFSELLMYRFYCTHFEDFRGDGIWTVVKWSLVPMFTRVLFGAVSWDHSVQHAHCGGDGPWRERALLG